MEKEQPQLPLPVRNTAGDYCDGPVPDTVDAPEMCKACSLWTASDNAYYWPQQPELGFFCGECLSEWVDPETKTKGDEL